MGQCGLLLRFFFQLTERWCRGRLRPRGETLTLLCALLHDAPGSCRAGTGAGPVAQAQRLGGHEHQRLIGRQDAASRKWAHCSSGGGRSGDGGRSESSRVTLPWRWLCGFFGLEAVLQRFCAFLTQAEGAAWRRWRNCGGGGCCRCGGLCHGSSRAEQLSRALFSREWPRLALREAANELDARMHAARGGRLDRGVGAGCRRRCVHGRGGTRRWQWWCDPARVAGWNVRRACASGRRRREWIEAAHFGRVALPARASGCSSRST